MNYRITWSKEENCYKSMIVEGRKAKKIDKDSSNTTQNSPETQRKFDGYERIPSFVNEKSLNLKRDTDLLMKLTVTDFKKKESKTAAKFVKENEKKNEINLISQEETDRATNYLESLNTQENSLLIDIQTDITNLGYFESHQIRYDNDNESLSGQQISLTGGIHQDEGKGVFQQKTFDLNNLKPVGLINHGNTCYFNCTMQLLFHNTTFYHQIFQLNMEQGSCQRKHALLNEIKSLFTKMTRSNNSVVDPDELISFLELNKDLQEDVSEFFTSIINKLIKESTLNNYLTNELFGTIQRTFRCISCGNSRKRNEEFFIYNCPLEKKINNLQDYIIRSLQKEMLTDNNRIDCSKCGQVKITEVTKVISKMPKIYYVSLQRTEFINGKMIKNKQKIIIPEYLELENIKNDPYGFGRYKLAAYISHLGARPNTGHFVTTIRKNNRWFTISDSKVSEEMCFGKIESSDAFLFEYRLEEC